ncbi:MAG TPA: BTAD domain-containing putative transcriptional regulator [Gaiellaceae bacterium]|nr:BTAD domain-containing putative transcriptional regulator [Gaiellaceae bacterium]
MSRHEFRVLGTLEVATERGEIELGAPRQRVLLALLALNANRVVPRDRIIDVLWGEQPPRTARNALQVAVHELRKALGADRVETRGTGYRLALAAGELDLDRFTHLLERAEREDPARAANTLREALSLHRGFALSDLPESAFVAVERERIEELRLVALERRIDTDLAVARHYELVPELESLVAEHPFRERIRGQLMLALYRSGRQADALQAFRDARGALVEELGVEPSHELQELHAAILRQDDALRPRAPSPGGTTNLPSPARPLVGRELELAAITALVRAPEARLVTLTGPGGTGKTRLALDVARGLLGEFEGGIRLVDLAPIRDPALVGPTTARILGVHDDEDALVSRIEAAVGDRDTLVVLDNVEHVLEATPFVAEVLARVPYLRVLATSREPLRIGAEREYRVPPLELPARSSLDLGTVARAEAVALFVARARAAQPEFELDQENVGAVVTICHALDGLPLALELAAARLKLLSPDALLQRLEDRLGVLAGGERDLPDRQRTLRATLDWSYRLLTPEERSLLARLAVFAGGWTLEAAEDVAGADLETLGSLVEKSLVRSERGADGAPRFSMLETIREYALERLVESDDADATRNRHSVHFADFAEGLEPDLHTAKALDRAEREHDNIRAALETAVGNGDASVALRLCAIARLWYVRGYATEGRLWVERSLTAGDGDPGQRARALNWDAIFAWTSGDHDAAVAPATESLALSRELGDKLGAMRSLMALGLAQLGRGDPLASRRFHRESLELAQELADERAVALALANLSDVAFVLGEYDEAETLATQSLEVARHLGDEEIIGVALLELGAAAIARGKLEVAEPLILESLGYFRRVDFKDFVASSLVALARACAAGDPTRAARLLGAAGVVRAPLGPAQFPWERSWFEQTQEIVRRELGEAAADQAIRAGESEHERVLEDALGEAP